MAQQYAELVKKLNFKDAAPDSFQQGVEIGKSFHGMNVHIRYGTYGVKTGPMSAEAAGTHKHDFDQLLLWIGSDTEDLLDLGAEIEVCLGEEREKHRFTSPTAIAVPRGMPHFPATIRECSKPFQYMEISLAPEYSATPVPIPADAPEAPLVSGFKSKYSKHVMRLPFIKKGKYFYGANNPEDSGGIISFVTGGDSGLDLHVSFETVSQTPYTFGPVPHGPHAHKFEEILLFMSADCNNLNDLDVEGDVDMGRERETLSFAGPVAIVCPYQLPHCPLTVTRLAKPFLFMVVSCAAEHH